MTPVPSEPVMSANRIWKSCCTCCTISSDLEVIADLLWRMGGESSQVSPDVPWLPTPRLRSMPVPLVSHGFWSHSNGGSVMNNLLATAITAVSFILPLVLSAAGRDGDHYAKVEIKGIIQTNMAAIGGERIGRGNKDCGLFRGFGLGEKKGIEEIVRRI